MNGKYNVQKYNTIQNGNRTILKIEENIEIWNKINLKTTILNYVLGSLVFNVADPSSTSLDIYRAEDRTELPWRRRCRLSR